MAFPGIGDELAGYVLESELGRGEASTVFLATDTRLDRKVALRVAAPEPAGDTGSREDLRRGLDDAAPVEHPNLIAIYEVGEADGVLFVAMQYVEGSSLRQLLVDDGQLTPARTAELVTQVAGALDAVHAASLVHRDVKPADILIAGTGEAFLSDLGWMPQTEAEGASFVSLDYRAPEQLRGDPVDGRADVYALGAVAYHCLAGQPPFAKETEDAVRQAHLEEPVPAVSTVSPGLPQALDAVLDTALAKEPSERYEQAGAFAAALQEAVASGAETVAAPVAAAVAAEPTALAAASVAAAAPAGRSRNWVLPGVAALAAVGVLAAFLIFGTGGGDDTDTVAGGTTQTGTQTEPLSPTQTQTQDETSGATVATVAGLPISKSRYAMAITRQTAGMASQGQPVPAQGTAEYKALESQALWALVLERARSLEAEKRGIVVSEAEIDSRIEQVKAGPPFNGDEAAYRAELKKEGLTEAELRLLFADLIRTEQLKTQVTKGIAVTDGDVHTYYVAHKADFPASREVQEILVGKNKAKLAQQILQQLKSGGDFAKLAKKYSQDPGSKDTGGFFTANKGQTVPEFDRVAFALKTGELGIVKTPEYGWFVIKPLKPVKNPTEKDVAEHVRQQLLAEKSGQAYSDFLSGLSKDICAGGKISYETGYTPEPDPCVQATAAPATG